jgi:hypothetical protein
MQDCESSESETMNDRPEGSAAEHEGVPPTLDAATDANVAGFKEAYLAAETAESELEAKLEDAKKTRHAAAVPIAKWLASKGPGTETEIGASVYTAGKAKGSDVYTLKKARARKRV